ncbi:MAG: MFS transporter [Nocardioidaceae bacterium]
MAIVDESRLLSSREPAGRWVLFATVLGTGIAFLDATVVNIALPAIGRELDTDLAGLQWTVNGYTLTLASFILLGGSLGDRFGRRRMFVFGVVWFAVASLLCGIAPNVETLVAARALQGIGGALLTPGSLAILQASFVEEDRGRVIGAWSGLSGVAGAVGPFLGGWLVETATWRLVFLINVPLAALVVVVCLRHVPESIDPMAPRRFDFTGSALCAIGLAGLTYGLIAWGESGTATLPALLTLAGGLGALVLFVLVERSSDHPMMPLDVFDSPVFRAVNLVTFAVYAALGGLFFMLVITLQVVAGFSPMLAGTALLPVTAIMLALSSWAGGFGQRVGPRLPMTVGPLVAAAGMLLLSRIGPGASYVVDVLPGVVVFGLGLSLTVAPLTATVLSSASQRHAGVASGVNNAIARSAGLLIVAALPLLVGLSGDAYADPVLLEPAFAQSMLLCAGLLVVGGVLAAVSVRPAAKHAEPEAAETEVAEAGAAEPGAAAVEVELSPCRVYCAIAGTPLHPSAQAQPPTQTRA